MLLFYKDYNVLDYWSFYSIKKSTDLKFVDELVHGVLRNKDIYKDDLNTLKKKVKPETCDSE